MAESSDKPDWSKPNAWWAGGRPEMGVAFWWASNRYHTISYAEYREADFDGETLKLYFYCATITITGKNLFELAEAFRRQVVWYVRERHVSLVDAEHEEHGMAAIELGPPEPSAPPAKPKERVKGEARKISEPA
jgi:hypothetical protein